MNLKYCLQTKSSCDHELLLLYDLVQRYDLDLFFEQTFPYHLCEFHSVRSVSVDAYGISTDIDILSETVGLQNLCIVHNLKTGRGKPGLVKIFDAINGNHQQNDTLANIVIEQASRLSFMSK